MSHKFRHRQIQRLKNKYKNLAAIVAAATILSAGVLPGIPATIAHASPTDVSATTSQQVGKTNQSGSQINFNATTTKNQQKPQTTTVTEQSKQDSQANRKTKEAKQDTQVKQVDNESKQDNQANRKAEEAKQDTQVRQAANESRQDNQANKKAEEAKQNTQVIQVANESKQDNQANKKAEEAKQNTQVIQVANENKQDNQTNKKAEEAKQNTQVIQVANESKQAIQANQLPADTSPTNYKQVLDISATAYAPGPHDNGQWGNKTHIGTQVRPGVIAVDPKIIPLGSRVYIEYPDGHGEYAVAEDTGGAIKGNRVDIAKWTVNEAKDFGIQNVKVYVLHTPEKV